MIYFSGMGLWWFAMGEIDVGKARLEGVVVVVVVFVVVVVVVVVFGRMDEARILGSPNSK